MVYPRVSTLLGLFRPLLVVLIAFLAYLACCKANLHPAFTFIIQDPPLSTSFLYSIKLINPLCMLQPTICFTISMACSGCIFLFILVLVILF